MSAASLAVVTGSSSKIGLGRRMRERGEGRILFTGSIAGPPECSSESR